jgi:EmrB/QacA subfamily drug resistance transporter
MESPSPSSSPVLSGGGTADSIEELILCRAIQGLGAGGTLALAYIVVADLSPPDKRGKMLGFTSCVWGMASILGPALGGSIVTYFSWRWIFFINIPLGYAALLGILLYLEDVRQKKSRASVDFAGVLTLSVAVVALLGAFMLSGQSGTWYSREVLSLLLLALSAGLGFLAAERYADEPLLSPAFFRKAEFSLANGSAFFSSFGISSLLAFAPFFIQGALGGSPAQVGVAMVPLSFGWAGGSLICGQVVNRLGERRAAILGALLLVWGSSLLLTFTPHTTVWLCSTVLALAGVGMGFVATPTLLIVQNSLGVSNLGIATSSQQFARTLGGTIGVGVSGSFVTARFSKSLEALMASPLNHEIPPDLFNRLDRNLGVLFQPQIHDILSPGVQRVLQTGVGQAVEAVFWATLAASLFSLVLCCLLPVGVKRPE